MVGRRVAVIGDVMLDAYITGDVTRISPEAPVPVMKVQQESHLLGGAGNVGKCLAALGAEVRLVGLVGEDADAALLRREAESLGMQGDDLIATADRPTIRKTRVVARHQQVIRLDYEDVQPLDAATEKALIKRAVAAAKWADAIILSDYDKAALSPAVCQTVIQAAGEKPVLVDPKRVPWDKFKGSSHLKPNLAETSDWAGQAVKTSDQVVDTAKQLAKQLEIPNIIITRGGDGITMLRQTQTATTSKPSKSTRYETQHLPATPIDVFDVTGAGDIVASVITLALAAEAQLDEAVYLANIAAGIKVARFGAASVSNQEILDTVHERTTDCSSKIMNASEAAELAQRFKQRQKKVAFTNGCFDILHVGHVRYLEASRQLGDALIVGINSDASVRRLKGEGRPVQTQQDRAHILASQACVDAVVIFDEDTPLELIQTIQPDVLTKGADYKRKQDIVGYDVVESYGGQVHRIPLVAGRSTTRLIEKTK